MKKIYILMAIAIISVLTCTFIDKDQLEPWMNYEKQLIMLACIIQGII